MLWIASTEKDTAAAAREKRLLDAADQCRVNSGVKSQEYCAPVLGLILLRFTAHQAKLEKTTPSTHRGSVGERVASASISPH